METISDKKWKSLLTLAKKGDSAAQWELGYYYEYGATTKLGKLLTKENPNVALHWYIESAQQENANAQLAISNLLSGRLEPDYEAAIYWAKRAITNGNSSAAYNLGTIYRDLKKPNKAFRYYKKAAALGDGDALLQISLCYVFGHGVKRDIEIAKQFLNKTVKEKDRTTPRSRENAFYWLSIISLMGVSKSKRSLFRVKEMLKLSNSDGDHEQANDVLNVIGRA